MMTTSYEMFIQTQVPEDEVIVSRTNLDGIITYANEIFAHISGYKAQELIGKSHAIIRHPDMPMSVFKELWETIKRGETWSGYVKNLRKDKGYYWVYATVSGVYKDGKLIEYKSIRTPVSAHMQQQMQDKYDQMRLDEEDEVRIVCYLKGSHVEKIQKAAQDSTLDACRFLDEIIEKSPLI
jgi:aerotaxis receptor